MNPIVPVDPVDAIEMRGETPPVAEVLRQIEHRRTEEVGLRVESLTASVGRTEDSLIATT